MRTVFAAILILPALLLLSAALPLKSAAASNIQRPSYWIKKLKSPDRAVLTPEEIEKLNKGIIEKTPHMADLSAFPDSIPYAQLMEWLLYDPVPGPEALVSRVDSNGAPVADGFFTGLAYNMNMDGIGENNEVRFGVVVQRADIRAFPTDERLLKPGKFDFDAFQYSSIHPPEAVALLHQSRDGQWGFFQTPAVRGWIRLDKVAFYEKNSLPEDKDKTLVVVASSVEIYSDKGLKDPIARLPMGTVLKFTDEKDKKLWAVRYPQRSEHGALWIEAYLRKGPGVRKGFLPYTPKNVIAQAFKMLGEEYGWGGRGGLRDCSLFIQDIFATMGIRMPRHSGNQGLSGEVKSHAQEIYTSEELESALASARPGITILTLKGHVMLYIGRRNSRPYVIHQIFGYMDADGLNVINKVAVTGLELGKSSKEGPLKKRVKSVTEIVIPDRTGAL